MGVLLRGPQGDFILNNHGWALLLRLAWDYGWRPRGTVAPAHWRPAGTIEGADFSNAPKWNPADYVTGRGQGVMTEDARDLAEALASIIDDLPNHDPLSGETVVTIDTPGFPRLRVMPHGRPLNAFELFGGQNKQGFRAFIDYCGAGPFTIW